MKANKVHFNPITCEPGDIFIGVENSVRREIMMRVI